MKRTRTQLDHWAALLATLDQGGVMKAAEALNRSQSAVSYAIHTLEKQLGVVMTEPDGRGIKITVEGLALLRDARMIVQGLHALETRAQQLQQGWEAEVRLAVEAAFPLERLLTALADFTRRCPSTHIQLHEEVLSGTDEALLSGRADVVIGTNVPPGVLGEWLINVEFVAMSHPDHPLQQLGRPVELEDLARHTQVVVRDSGRREPRDAGWLGSTRRWTVTTGDTALTVVRSGLAYAWLPKHRIEDDVAAGRLRALPLVQGQSRQQGLYLMFAPDKAHGPACKVLAEALRAVTLAPEQKPSL